MSAATLPGRPGATPPISDEPTIGVAEWSDSVGGWLAPFDAHARPRGKPNRIAARAAERHTSTLIRIALLDEGHVPPVCGNRDDVIGPDRRRRRQRGHRVMNAVPHDETADGTRDLGDFNPAPWIGRLPGKSRRYLG